MDLFTYGLASWFSESDTGTCRYAAESHPDENRSDAGGANAVFQSNLLLYESGEKLSAAAGAE